MMVVKMTTLVGGDPDDADSDDYGYDPDDGDGDDDEAGPVDMDK